MFQYIEFIMCEKCIQQGGTLSAECGCECLGKFKIPNINESGKRQFINVLRLPLTNSSCLYGCEGLRRRKASEHSGSLCVSISAAVAQWK